MTIVYIGLGSNLDKPAEQLQQAVNSLKLLPQSSLQAVSSLYASKPMGPQDQPDYINAVACISTTLPALELLDELQQIELTSGRVRKDQRWGARVLDLDVLLFGDELINTERLTVPHYGMKVREFVIFPLAEINPKLILPTGESVITLQNNLAKNGLFIVGKLH
ncbi:2-amino-4-hydroxy-6-hydroxymethyldihydropteridine diphosphokinase [Colwelliaceae bacterium BS250]